MQPTNNSLDQSYSTPAQGSSLETPVAGMTPIVDLAPVSRQPSPLPPRNSRGDRFSVFRFNRSALLITTVVISFIALVGLGGFVFSSLSSKAKTATTQNSGQPSSQYAVNNLPLQGLNATNQLQIGKADSLAINGQLLVNSTLVLTPTAVPTAPVTGQLYYDKTNNRPYFYNGAQFVSLEPAAVSSIGGANGIVGLGQGLQINGNQLSISGTLLQTIANAGLGKPSVASLQGLSGALTLTAGNGIAITGTTITNNGVTALTSSDSSITIAANGNGSYDITAVPTSGAAAITLAPTTVQADATNRSTQHINKTGTGNFFQYASNGVDTFVVNQTGQITSGTINYSQVLGTPTTVVNSVAGVSGALTLGSGLTVSGSALYNSGVTGLTGTANQINVSAATGNVTLTLPQNINATAAPTFSGATLGQASTTSGSLVFANSTNAHLTTLQGLSSATQNQTVTIPASSATTDTVCLVTLANCTGSGGISGTGTAGTITKFSAAGVIANSSLTESGTTVTASGNLIIQGANSLTLGTAATNAGSISFNNAAVGALHSVTLQAPTTDPATNLNFKLPSADGSSGYCLQTNGAGVLAFNACTGGGAGGVTSLDAQGGVLTLANSAGSAGTITINDASTAQKGIAQFNSTNFSASAGTINTIQDIAVAASPTFANLTVQGATGLTLGSATNSGKLLFKDGTIDGFTSTFSPTTLTASHVITIPNAAGTLAVSASGNLSLSALGDLTTIANPTFATSVTTPSLQSSGALAITPGGALTVGSTAQTFTVQGSATSVITATSGANTTTLSFTAPTANRAIVLPDVSGTLCTTATCAGSSGSGSYIQNQNSAQQAGSNFWISGSGRADTSLLTPTLDTAAAVALNIGNANASAINLGNTTNNIVTTINGTAIIKPTTAHDSVTAFQVQTSAATPVLTVDTTNQQTILTSGGTDAVLTTANVDTASAVQDLNSANWTSTNWTTAANSATHVTGNISALTNTGFTPTIGTTYQVSYSYNNCTSGTNTLTITMGGVTLQNANDCIGTNTQVITATSTANLTFTPSATYVGVVSGVKIQAITQIAPVLAVKNSSNIATLEVRSSGSTSNTFVGISAGKNNTSSGTFNTALGSYALLSNTTGYGNTSVGAYSLKLNTTGYYDTGLGVQALRNNSTGYMNTAVGYQALYNNTTGTSNTATGVYALQANTTGSDNTAMGNYVLQNNSTGYNNIAFGDYSLQFNTTGISNTANGYSSLRNNTTGYQNTANGVDALQSNTTGVNNAALGFSALQANTTGFQNTALGYGAGSGITTGTNNTLLGYNAGIALTTGSNNVGIGQGVVLASATGSNQLQIGAGISGDLALGTLAVKTITNSSTGFQVQNTAGSAILTADTTNGQLILGTSSSLTGKIQFLGSGGTGTLTVVGPTTPNVGNFTLSIPAITANANICTDNSVCAGYAASGGANPIQNQNASQQASSNFWISGSGRADASFLTPTIDTATATSLNIGITNATSITLGKAVNTRVNVGSIGTPVGQLYVAGQVPTSAIGNYVTGTNANPISVAVSGRYAYVVNFSTGTLQIVDASTPSSPVLAGSVVVGGNPTSIVVSGRYAYVTNSSNILTYDISNPHLPTLVNSNSAGSGPRAVAVSGRYAYVVGTGGWLYSFDISNPNSILNAGLLNLGGQYYSITIQGHYAYIANFNGAMNVVDISNPYSMSSVSSFTVGTQPTSVAVSGRYAYIVNTGSSTLQVLDVSNPALPVSVGTVSTNSGPYSVTVSGRYAYVGTASGSSVQVFDISNYGSAPTLVGTVGAGASVESVAVSGRYLYAAVYGASFLSIFDMGGTYSQSLETGSIETTNLRVQSDTSIGGSLSIETGLNVGGSALINGDMSANGAATFKNKVNSTTAFQVQNAAGSNILAVDTTNAQTVLGTSGSVAGKLQVLSSSNYNTVTIVAGATAASYSLTLPTAGPAVSQCLQSDSVTASQLKFASCGSTHAKTIILTAEYAGAVLDAGTGANNSGTITSGIDLTNRQNYYKWVTTQATSQSYDVDIQVPIPSDFSAWGGTPLSIATYTTDTTNGTSQVEARDTTGTVETGCNFAAITPTVASTWQTKTCTIAGTYTAGGYMTLRLRMYSTSAVTAVQIGNITLNYTSAY